MCVNDGSIPSDVPAGHDGGPQSTKPGPELSEKQTYEYTCTFHTVTTENAFCGTRLFGKDSTFVHHHCHETRINKDITLMVLEGLFWISYYCFNLGTNGAKIHQN